MEKYSIDKTTICDGVQVSYEVTENDGALGWICPKCGRSISPQYKTCPYCSTQAADEGLAPGEQIIYDAM